MAVDIFQLGGRVRSGCAIEKSRLVVSWSTDMFVGGSTGEKYGLFGKGYFTNIAFHLVRTGSGDSSKASLVAVPLYVSAYRPLSTFSRGARVSLG